MKLPADRALPAWAGWLAAAVLAGAIWLAYQGTVGAPLVFDDTMAIERNSSIRRLWPPTALTSPPFDTSVSGRPVLNLSLALNYAISGLDVRSYHFGNLAIHFLAALTLYGFLGRTLARTGAPGDPRTGIDGALLAGAVALLWALHPLQTESVTYVIQRAESLMALFYLLTLYLFVRGVERVEAGRGGGAWWTLSWLACLAGMGTKEVMVSAPVFVLLYDRTFVTGNFREAWCRRRAYYLGLAATLGLVAWLALGTKSRNGTAGFGIGVRWWDYFLTQFPALWRYLRLTFWPQGQVFDYGALWVAHPWSVWPEALLAAGLLAGSAAAFCYGGPRRRTGVRAVGFAGLWFFAILAPTSIVPGNRQTIAEHRMYLALAPLLAALGVGVAALLARAVADDERRRKLILVGTGVLAVALGATTAHRNLIYGDGVAIWSDTVAHNPGNVFARSNLGNVLLAGGQRDAAVAQYREALRLNPDFPEGHNNYGTALAEAGQNQAAEAEYRKAIALKHEFYADAHNNLGVALARDGDVKGAVAEFEAILQQYPVYHEVRFNYGNALARLGRLPEALREYRAALSEGFDIAELHNNLGNTLLALNQPAEAMAEFGKAVRMRPTYAEAYNNLGSALFKSGRPQEAVREYQQAVWLRPRFTEARLNLANALATLSRLSEAETQYREVVAMEPDNINARNNLGIVLAEDNQFVEAVVQYEQALLVTFNAPEVHNNLGSALLHLQRRAEARKEFAIAVQLKPDYAKARENLARLDAEPPGALMLAP